MIERVVQRLAAKNYPHMTDDDAEQITRDSRGNVLPQSRLSRNSDPPGSPSLSSSHRRGYLLPNDGPLRNLHRHDGRESCYGALRFAGSKRPPAKWVCVSDKTDENTMEQLGELFLDTWKLRPPAVLISVTGAADRDMFATMTEKQQLVFRRGLNNAAKITKAWVITGGTNAGVMSMVGRTLSDADHSLPCIGIATWGVVAGHEQMGAAQSGRVLKYAELLREAAHRRKEARQAAGADSASAYGSQGKGGLDGNSNNTPPAPAQTSLEPNHSHFVLVDDGTVGKFGSEIQVRAALEDAVRWCAPPPSSSQWCAPSPPCRCARRSRTPSAAASSAARRAAPAAARPGSPGPPA